MTEVTLDASATGSGIAPAASRQHVVRAVLRNPLGLASAVWLLLVVVACVAGPLLAPYDANTVDLLAAAQGPSSAHLLGTDGLGRDILSRLIMGAAPSMLGVVIAMAVFAIIGIPVGLLVGYYGGWLDSLIGRVNEVVMSLPGLIILLVVLTVFPNDQNAAMVTFGILGSPGLIRVVRSVTLAVRDELYVAAARVFGLRDLRIIWRHVWPRIRSAVIVQLALWGAASLAIESGIAFLGFGPNPPTPTWGGIIQDSLQQIFSQAWQILPGGIVIALTIVAFGLVGNAVRDAVSSGWSRPQVALLGRPARAASAPAIGAAPARAGRADAAPLLAVRGLRVTIEGPAERHAVHGVDLEIAAGETVGIVGESGCGKSLTTLGIVGALPPGVAMTAGEVVFAGAVLTGEARERARGTGIGYVSQEPMLALDPMFTVGSQLMEAIRRHQGVGKAAARAEAIDLLSSVRLRDPAAALRQYPHQLSGGMAQRVAIALALAGRPALLVADEPTTALDVTTQAEILALLRDLSDGRGMATLIITHDWGVVAELCDRAVVMYAGEVVEEGPVDSLFFHPRHPYTAALLESNPHVALVTGRGEEQAGTVVHLPTIPGEVPLAGVSGDGCAFADRCQFALTACRAAPIPLAAVNPEHLTRCIRSEEVTARGLATHG